MRPIVLLLACAALVACGSEDDDGLSADEYRKRANELCAQANRELEEADVPNSVDELADFLEQALELQRKYERRYRALDPPERFEDLHEEGLRLSEKVDDAFSDIIDRLRRSGDPRTLQRGIQKLLPEVRRTDEINRELNLDECLKTPTLGEQPAGPS